MEKEYTVEGFMTYAKLKHNLMSIKLGKMTREDPTRWSNFSESFYGKRKIEYAEYSYPIVSDSSMKGFAIYKKD